MVQQGSRMKISCTTIGLIFDILGFLIIFCTGGFEIGHSAILLEDDTSDKWRPLKIIAAILVLVGFSLQILGSWSAN